jgi:DNA-binding response OmpR family regulator
MEATNFLNLLIVDDERAIREVCREVAQSLGFNTAVADSAEHAYRLLETQNIDVVLLDLKLPGAGGLEALHQIGERKPDAVIVVVTGYGTVQSAVQAMKNAACDYVTKPFSMEELRLLLERVSGHLKLKNGKPDVTREDQIQAGFREHRRSGAGDGKTLSHHRQSRAQQPSRAHPGRERDGKGDGGTVQTFLRALPRQTIYSGGLRVAGSHPD